MYKPFLHTDFEMKRKRVNMRFIDNEGKIYNDTLLCYLNEKHRCAFIRYATLKAKCEKYNAWHYSYGENKKEYDFDFDEDDDTLIGIEMICVYDKKITSIVCEINLENEVEYNVSEWE